MKLTDVRRCQMMNVECQMLNICRITNNLKRNGKLTTDYQQPSRNQEMALSR